MNANARPLARGLSNAQRRYSREARDTRNTAYAGLAPGNLHVREPSLREPVC